MTTLKDWKKSLESGVSVRTLLGLEEVSVPPEKNKKRKLPEDGDKPATSISTKEALRSSPHAASPKEITDFDSFEAAMVVKGFLGEPQHFQWSNFPISMLLQDKSNADNPEVHLQSPVPSVSVKEVLGPCFIAALPPSLKREDDSCTSDEGQ